ncbi:HK97 gp10 family phage protein [Methylococcaceae bacterium WWC4]|nr:HK97 gp10 family phage protein [Methylococcaceae bacterium WWC4]
MADESNAQLVVNAAAERFVLDTLEWISAGHAFTSRTGQLEQSINWHPAGDGGAVIYASAEYAGWVEEGTEPHVIRPKDGRKGLKIPTGGNASPVGPQLAGGGYVIVKQVNHPGSRPFPFFFADLDNRQAHMQQAGLSVLASRLTGL